MRVPSGIIVGAVGLDGKAWENPQFDHESIRPRRFAFSTFLYREVPERLRILN
jgi:hypothetical protein